MPVSATDLLACGFSPLTANVLIDALNDRGGVTPTLLTVSRELTDEDFGRTLVWDGSTSISITFPAGLSGGFDVTFIYIGSGGDITPVAGAGVTFLDSVVVDTTGMSVRYEQAETDVYAAQQYGGSVVGSGTVTSVSVVTANGISGSVANATTTPAITLALGAITPSSVNGVVIGAGITGTVISVAQSFTGGLISVSGSPITTSGTLALTVAGTSGGIPYFSSSSTWASSAALAANQIVLGGGAGTTPATLGSLGTTATVLHGNAAGAPTFGAIVTADITDANVTYGKIQNVATARLLGRATAGSGVVEEITLGSTLAFTGTTLDVTAAAGAPFSDASALVKNASDATKLAIFSATGITTGTTRTYTLPNVSDTLAVKGANSFTAAQTITSSAADALAVGGTGATNPAFIVDAQTTGTGLSITSVAAASKVVNVKGTGGTGTTGIQFLTTGLDGFSFKGNNGILGIWEASTTMGLSVSASGTIGWVASGTIDFHSNPPQTSLGQFAAQHVMLGWPATASAVAYTLSGTNSRSGTDTNTAGGNLTVASGRGTGTAAITSLILQSPVAVASGTGAQTMTTGLTIKAGCAVRPSYAVADLPAAGTAGAGAMAWVTDANATTFLSTVAGGGANKVPVSSDGTNWLIG